MEATALEHAAAVLAAAFVTSGNVGTVEDAARRYFDCLDALKAEGLNRANASRQQAASEVTDQELARYILFTLETEPDSDIAKLAKKLLAQVRQPEQETKDPASTGPAGRNQ